jgi:fibronectin type 3 domain-containing protein
VRAIVWVGLGILALNVLLVAVLALIGSIRRFQIARTRRELERLGFVVRLPYANEGRPILPRLLAGIAGIVVLVVTTSAITGAPSARTLASPAGSTSGSTSTHAPVVHPAANPGSDPVSADPTPSEGVASSDAPASTSASPAQDAGSDAGAPSTVAAVSTSATAIRLEWTAVSDASRYDIERSRDDVTWNAVASTGGAQTAYTDVALSAGTTYYYRVAAYVDGQGISRSDAVSATTTVDTSTPPVFISATAADSTSIELQWADVDGELGYWIERSPDGTAGWTGIGTTGQDVTSYTDTGLAAATSYSYRIVAVTADGESSPSTVLSATTDPPGPTTSEVNGPASP